ncbi:MAG: thymidine phosphorylase [Deinococcales bacterium]
MSFDMLTFIQAKKLGLAHQHEDLAAMLKAYIADNIPDYQVSAWLMAVYFQGMSPQETADLTEAMAGSGDSLDLSSLAHTVDKHSTGGVGDKTSLVLAPLLASCGVTVAKMSGRGLGHTGGTVDKLESIPGFQSSLSEQDFLAQAKRIGLVLSGQSKDLAPADAKLYSLRDVTATVDSLPLIASSIMSKKLASGSKTIVLDVKVGSGAFMKTLADAEALARAMLDIGQRKGRYMRAVLTNMDVPLGQAVGNALEVQEAIGCLKAEVRGDLRELCLVLAEELLAASGKPLSPEAIAKKIDSGLAWQHFKAWIEAQGGDLAAFEALPKAPQRYSIQAQEKGYVSAINALAVGQAVKFLGGGRQKKSDPLDLSAGVMVKALLGQEVAKGDELFEVHYRHKGIEEAKNLLTKAVQISPNKPAPHQLIYKRLNT